MPILSHCSAKAPAGCSPAVWTLYTLLTTANEATTDANKQYGDLINFKLCMLYISGGEMQKFGEKSIFDKWLQMLQGKNGQIQEVKVGIRFKKGKNETGPLN